jgi:RNA polymerase sigma factor (sigma-70 family)
VVQKLQELKGKYSGDPALYFYGVARNISLEYMRKHRRDPLMTADLGISPPEHQPTLYEQQYNCLEECLEKLSPANRELILSYYSQKKRAKVEYRKQLAEKLGIEVNALRVRAFRVREALEKCVRACLDSR